MVSIDDVVLDDPDGGILNIIVHANSRKNEFFTSIDTWRKALHCYLIEPARHGRANREIIRNFSDIFHVQESSVNIKTGRSSPIKRVQIKGKPKIALVDIIKKIQHLRNPIQ